MAYIGKIKNGNTTWPIATTLYGTCETAAWKTAKVVTCADFNYLMSGVSIDVKFSNANTATSPTLNVNSTGAKTISVAGGNKKFPAGLYRFTYDGSNWVMENGSTAAWISDGSHSYSATDIYNAIDGIEDILASI